MELFFQTKGCGVLVNPIASLPKSFEVGVRVGTPPLPVRLKRLNSRSFSCGVMAPLEHSFGKVTLVVFAVPGSSTWYSLKRTRPHWFCAPMGVLKVSCITGLLCVESLRVSQDCVGAMTPFMSCLTAEMDIWPLLV